MSRLPESAYVLISGEPYLSRARQYRILAVQAKEAWRLWAQERGAEEIVAWHRPSGLKFSTNHAPPEGWTKPSRRGISFPRQRSAELGIMLDLPELPTHESVFTDIPDTLRWYNRPFDCGFVMIGDHTNPSPFFLGWASETFLAIIPHFGNAVKNHLSTAPEDKIVGPNILEWQIPPGLTQITKAKFELVYAQHKVAQEDLYAKPQA